MMGVQAGLLLEARGSDRAAQQNAVASAPGSPQTPGPVITAAGVRLRGGPGRHELGRLSTDLASGTPMAAATASRSCRMRSPLLSRCRNVSSSCTQADVPVNLVAATRSRKLHFQACEAASMGTAGPMGWPARTARSASHSRNCPRTERSRCSSSRTAMASSRPRSDESSVAASSHSCAHKGSRCPALPATVPGAASPAQQASAGQGCRRLLGPCIQMNHISRSEV